MGLQWLDTALVVWERVAAVIFHIGAAVLVMQTVLTGRRIWWVVAVVGHAAVQRDRPRSPQFGGAVWAELVATPLCAGGHLHDCTVPLAGPPSRRRPAGRCG